MKAGQKDGLPLQHRLDNFLLLYRATPHATTGVPPATLFLGRELRTRLHLLDPPTSMGARVAEKQANQKDQHDRRAQTREFTVGQTVMARNLRPGPKYVPGVIIQKQGPLSYLVEVQNGITWRRHVDHLKELVTQEDLIPAEDVQPDADSSDQDVSFPSPEAIVPAVPVSSGSSPDTGSIPAPSARRQNPQRSRNPPAWYGSVVTHA